jgi:oligopeptide transport system substrate-binding protein
MILIASSFITDTTPTAESLIEGLVAAFGGETAPKILSEKPVALQDGVEATDYLVDFTTAAGEPLSFHLALAERGPKVYTFLVLGAATTIHGRGVSIQSILESISLNPSTLFGIDRNQAVVQLGYDPQPMHLDPALTTGSAEGYIGHLFSGLVRLSPALQVEPDLAADWEVSEDGRVYTFHLREGSRFASGQAITAEDVKYSWERAADPDTGSSTASTYLGDIIGVQAKLDGEAEEVAGIRVIDDQTLEVTLDQPVPYFLAKLTYPTSFIVDQANVEGDPEGWMFEPNASGPYVLREILDEEAVVFERNENYHTPPGIRYAVYLLYLSGTGLSFFEAGEVDIIGLGIADVQQVQESDDPYYDQLLSVPSMCTSLIMVDTSMPPMDDPQVRMAFALAVDKESIAELVYEDLILVADTILPPAMPGFSDALGALPFDPEAAREALASSEYADGLPPIRFTSSGFGDSDDPVADSLIETWQETLGAEIVVENLDPDRFTERALEDHGHLVDYGWCADYPDPQNFLDILFHKDSDFNVAGYTNVEVDALLEQARTELAPADRIALYQQIEDMLLEDIAAIPLFHGIQYGLVSSRINGFELSPMGVPIIHLLTLEENSIAD